MTVTTTHGDALLRPAVRDLPRYDAGPDPDDVPRHRAVIRLATNENPYGASPAVTAAVRLQAGGVARYPDPSGGRLTRALAERCDTSPRHVVLGNGSENVLELLCRAVLDPGDVAVTQTPGFSLHEIFPRVAGARVVTVAPGPGFGFDLDAWERALATRPKIVFLTNPCNPTGQALDRDQLDAVVDAVPAGALLVLDEAYVEYARADARHPDGLEALRHRDRPWIVLRTFSKAHGLAGLRVGYGVASDADLVEALHRVRTPYNVNEPAQHAAVAALGDPAHLDRVVARTVAERERVRALLLAAGLSVAPSAANFLFVDTGRAATAVAAELLTAGVVVKPWREPGWTTHIRASLSLPAENDVFVRELLNRIDSRMP